MNNDTMLPLPTEPTNMLDIRAILWLENYLQVYTGIVLFVLSSHPLFLLA